MVAALVGCGKKSPSSAASPAGGAQTGAASARAAVETMLEASRAQDLQAISAVWGNQQGPLRDRLQRTELEKRTLVMVCLLNNDRYAVTNERTDPGAGLMFDVALTRGNLTRETRAHAVQGPAGRWYVLEIEPNPLRDLCQQRPS
jgi:hypothetical protein